MQKRAGTTTYFKNAVLLAQTDLGTEALSIPSITILACLAGHGIKAPINQKSSQTSDVDLLSALLFPDIPPGAVRAKTVASRHELTQ